MAGIKHTCMQRCENRHDVAQSTVGQGPGLLRNSHVNIPVNTEFLTWYLTVSAASRQSEVMQKIRVKQNFITWIILCNPGQDWFLSMVHTLFMCIWANLEQPIDAWTKIYIRNKNYLICTVSNCVWLGRQGGMVHANYTTPHPFFSENSETAECIKNSSILSDICRIVASIHCVVPPSPFLHSSRHHALVIHF